jgi:hypothetical protein
MKKARIYRPAKNAMQSGRGNTHKWVLDYEPAMPKIIDNLMGWQGSRDMLQEIHLKFETKEEAIDYAKKNNIDFELFEPHQPKLKIKSYAENFTG